MIANPKTSSGLVEARGARQRRVPMSTLSRAVLPRSGRDLGNRSCQSVLGTETDTAIGQLLVEACHKFMDFSIRPITHEAVNIGCW